MNWSSYVHDSLLSSDLIESAAIFTQTGDVLAVSSGFKIIFDELKQLPPCFEQDKDLPETITIFGDPFTITRGTADSIHGVFDVLETGVCIYKTRTTYIFGMYKTGPKQDASIKLVEALGGYICSLGS